MAQVFGFDGDDFSVEIQRLDKEIKTNPLLVSQLAIIYKNDGSIPHDSMEMTEKLAEIVFGVEDRADVLDVKGAEITNLRALVEAFAALQYEYPEENDVAVMDEALESCNEHAAPTHVLEYFKKRAIYVDGRYLHKSLGEFFAAYGFARRACGLGGKVKDKELLDFVIRHCGDDSWGSIVNWFVRKTKLKTLVIPEEVKRIGKRAFYECGTLTSVTIPKSVTSIGDWAFSGCSGLKSITIPDSVTSIGWGVFYGCSGLTSITIPFVGEKMDGTENTRLDHIFVVDVPDSLKEVIITGGKDIDEMAFLGCSGLTNITIPDSVTSIGGSAFWGCSGLKSVTIPDGVTSIGEGAFRGCSGLTSVTIGNGATSIGDWAFDGCSGLKSITIPDSVTSIGEGAFSDCDGLTSVTIGNSVTNIGKWAFDGCSGLTDITYHGTMAQWRAIKKVYGWAKWTPDYKVYGWAKWTPDYKVYCTDGVLDKDDRCNI